MAITSGTALRIRIDGVTIANATSCQFNWNVNFRQLIHKDNPGQHDESLPDGISGTAQCDFYVENAGSYKTLFQAMQNQTEVELTWTTNVSTEDVYTVNAYVQSINSNAAVRESVTGSVQFRLVGAVTVGAVA